NAPKLTITGACTETGAMFTVMNSGGPILGELGYTLRSPAGFSRRGMLSFDAGKALVEIDSPYGDLTLTVDAHPGTEATVAETGAYCYPPKLEAEGVCTTDGARFTVTNTGGPITETLGYTLTSAEGFHRTGELAFVNDVATVEVVGA